MRLHARRPAARAAWPLTHRAVFEYVAEQYLTRAAMDGGQAASPVPEIGEVAASRSTEATAVDPQTAFKLEPSKKRATKGKCCS
jgi:hypothetical protein